MSWKVVSLFVPDVDAESLILALAQKGVCISAGAACDSYESRPSHVLSAMSISPERIRQSVRLSFSNDIPPEIYQYALKIIQSTIEELRSLNPNKNKEDA